ncbi:hypothetical protein, partial [Bombilactobacillus bombi]|uniref:hypothetical protein n=1 Tax=Bombilactobacillus bombi TaxID=1303590 RepID=UPI0015E5CD95
MTFINYEQKLIKYQSLFVDVPKFRYLLTQMQQVIQAYRQQRLPNFVLAKLEVNEVDFAQLIANPQFMPGLTLLEKGDFLQEFSRFLDDFRDFIQTKLGIWSLINGPMMDCWVQLFPDINYLELMAGNGILSAALKQRGQSVIATDNFSWSKNSQTGQQCWTNVEVLDALSALEKYHSQVQVVLLAWSPDKDRSDVAILKKIRQLQPFIQFWILGEYLGATNSTQFW